MKEQLNTLRNIIERIVAQENPAVAEDTVLRIFSADGNAETIEGVAWVSWSFSHQDGAETVIKEVFEKTFPGKEFSVAFNSIMGGARDHVTVTGKNITLDEVLGHADKVARQEKFKQECESFYQIVETKIDAERIMGNQEIVFAGTDVDPGQCIGSVACAAWALALCEIRPRANSQITLLDVIMLPLKMRLAPKHFDLCEIHYVPEEVKIIFTFKS